MTTTRETPFALELPSYSESDIKERPWILVELKIWNMLVTAIDSPTSNLGSAAQEINALFPSNRPPDLGPPTKEPAASFLLELWDIFRKAAGQIPPDHSAQEQLINLIKALRHLPDPTEIEFEGTWSGGNKEKLWTDLPKLSEVFHEAPDIDTGINVEAFMARLSGANLATFWWLALHSLSQALENEPLSTSRTYATRGPIIDGLVPRAVLWIRFAGAGLYEECLAGALKNTAYGLGGNWKGDRGLSKGRWELWKKRFGEIAVDERVVQETKEMARIAKSIMDEIDGNRQ